MTDQVKDGTMTTALSTLGRVDAELMERTLIGGDLSKLTPQDRVRYVVAVCHSVGLNPLTRPFEYVSMQGKLVLYAKKEATEQLRKLNDVSVTKLERQTVTVGDEEFQMVTASVVDAKGRTDASMGVVSLGGLRGEQRANAIMKAETKAKRRATLSLCGLGMLDETEVEVSPAARTFTETVTVDGERVEQAILFNTPEADRAALIQRARLAVARIEKARVQEMKQQHFGDAEAKYEGVDLAALVAFVQAVEDVRL